MQAQCECVVYRPIDRVFAFLADPRNRPRWQSSLTAIELLTEGEPRVGMRWRERPGGLFRFELSIVELEPNRLWTEQITGAGIEGRIAMRFAAEGGNTRIHVAIDLTFPKPLQLATPLVRPLLLTAVRSDLARVGQLL